jgi:hypothetical protein
MWKLAQNWPPGGSSREREKQSLQNRQRGTKAQDLQAIFTAADAESVEEAQRER